MSARTPRNKVTSIDIIVIEQQIAQRRIRGTRCAKRLDFSKFVVVKEKKNNEEDTHTQTEQEIRQKEPQQESIRMTEE